MNGKPWPKVDLEPLLAALKAADIDTTGNLHISLATGLHTRTVIRARQTGRLTTRSADIAATRALGAHPSAIWGAEWDNAYLNEGLAS